MNKIIAKDFRPTKEFTLPISKITLTAYPSVLISDIDDVKVGETTVSSLPILVKVIKEWNLYEKENDEKPLPINVENIKKLPAVDFDWFVTELKKFVDEQKKNIEISQS